MNYSIVLDVGLADRNPSFFANDNNLESIVGFFISQGYEVIVCASESVKE